MLQKLNLRVYTSCENTWIIFSESRAWLQRSIYKNHMSKVYTLKGSHYTFFPRELAIDLLISLDLSRCFLNSPLSSWKIYVLMEFTFDLWHFGWNLRIQIYLRVRTWVTIFGRGLSACLLFNLHLRSYCALLVFPFSITLPFFTLPINFD